MKELTLIRHAKSDWGEAGLDDHKRPLNSRGRWDAPRMAAELKNRNLLPDVMISSTALRAWSTSQLIAHGLGYPQADVLRKESLYLARPDEILRVVQEIDEDRISAVLFAHNPGIHEAAYLMLKDADRIAIDRFPTCAVARIRLPVEYWGNAAFGTGDLIDFLTPKGL